MNLKKIQLSLLVFTVGFSTGAYSQPFLNNGLIAYYPFNGNANDESGTSNNAGVNGATLSNDRFAEANQAYSFDGTKDFLSAPSSASLDLATNGTISLWMYWNGDNLQ